MNDKIEFSNVTKVLLLQESALRLDCLNTCSKECFVFAKSNALFVLILKLFTLLLGLTGNAIRMLKFHANPKGEQKNNH